MKIQNLVLYLAVLALLASCSVNRVAKDVAHKTELEYIECFPAINSMNKVASFCIPKSDTIYVVKQSNHDWAHKKYRKLVKGDIVLVLLVQKRKSSLIFGVRSAQRFLYNIDMQASHMLDFSVTGNVYDSPDIMISDKGEVYLRIGK